MTELARYQNGNCTVALESDGTKVREYEGVPVPEFPESIDLKITDYCDAACAFCHEKSTIRGRHAPLEHIDAVTAGLPAGVEIAIGGGNPLSHPQLLPILKQFRSQGLIANLTVHESHFNMLTTDLWMMQQSDLIHGIGVSITDSSMMTLLPQLDEPLQNVVWHMIAGISQPFDLLSHMKGERILVLGYKQFGRGAKFHSPAIEENLNQWRYWIGSILRRASAVDARLCFDNLALEQLRVRELITPEVWKQFYMGDDGVFTMYVDAVTDTFARSSTSPRIGRAGRDIRAIFQAQKEGV